MVMLLPGGISGATVAPGRLHLVPAVAGPRPCYRLAARCRELETLRRELGEAGLALPAGSAVDWLELPLSGLSPLVRLPMPAGEPMTAWLRGGSATAADFLAVLRDLFLLVDGLAGTGFLPDSIGVGEVWVSERRLSWLPGALSWRRRPGGRPSGEALLAAGRALALLLKETLLLSRTVEGIDLVWDELWLLCSRLLEHGIGLNAANADVTLGALQARCRGIAEPPSAGADAFVVVDAVGVQRWLGHRTLDLPGFLRAQLGAGRRVRGVAFGEGRLPGHWPASAKEAGLTWLASLDLGALGERARTLGAAQVYWLTGAGEGDALWLAPLRPVRGIFIALSGAAPVLPDAWAAAPPLPGPLHHWLRLGWPVKHRQEVPPVERD
ncbi:MAG TPA: hypothetical protein VD969_07285 [Symbiobacteriaceae bacterium]|nr:hypothetical protein [Symbiobacteriaceae bacterium]